MSAERFWVVLDLSVLAFFLLSGSHLLSDPDHRTASAILATLLSGAAVVGGIAFRKGLWNLSDRDRKPTTAE